MHELSARVTGVRELALGLYALGMEAPEIAAEAAAGQFVNLGLRPGPFLRRPFSVYRAGDGLVEVLLKPVGIGTEQLIGLVSGDRISCLGPLGRGFDFISSWGSVALVSGGLGVAPMALAARDAAAAGLRVTWVHGARSEADLCPEWLGDAVAWATDDGSRGHHGSALGAVPAEVAAVVACGPNRMLAAVASRWPDAQVAVETYMGCGTGVCLGCAVPLRAGGYDRACKEGPVYRAGSVDWEALPSHLHYSVTA